MPQHVKVVGAPGYVEEFRAVLVPGLHEVPAVDDRGPVSVISTEAGELLVVPSTTVQFTDVEPWPSRYDHEE